MTPARWIRLDTTWSQSEWLSDLEVPARLAWIELLCYVKAHGTAGAVKRLSPSVAARLWSVTRNAVTEMETAAQRDDALVIDDDEWVITGWADRQMDPNAAERMRRYRQRQQALTEDTPASPVTRNSRNVTPTETGTQTTKQILVGFDEFWSVYPKRAGANPKANALALWTKNRKRGVEASEMIKGAERYAAFCQATEKTGTEFVQRAITFLGGQEGWTEEWRAPSNGKKRDTSSNAGLRRRA